MIQIKNLKFSYGDETLALNDLSLDIKKGKYIAIMGENGAGKSTLIKHLNGLLKPKSGTVMIDGLSTQNTSVSKLSEKVGIVFQYPEFMFFSESVEEEISFALKNFGFEKEKIKTIISTYLKTFGLTRYLKQSPFILSGGEQRRLAIACILSWNPEYVVLDEPTAGQDKYQRDLLKKIISKLISENKTVIIVSHDVEFIAETQPYIHLMANGEIIGSGDAKDVLSDNILINKSGLIYPQINEFIKKLNWNLTENLLNPSDVANEILSIIEKKDSNV